MLPRRAKIVLCACFAACAGVWWNVMYLQHGTRPDLFARVQRLGETAFRRPPPVLESSIEQTGSTSGSLKEQPSPARADFDVDVVRAIQRELAQLGYEPGPADGLVHPVTRAAVMAYEHDHGLPLTGQPTEALLKAILFGVPSTPAAGSPREPHPEAREIIRSVQGSLKSLGYPIRSVDGRMGPETVRAIREFESRNGLTPSGRVSGALMLKLREATVRKQRRASAQ